MIEIGSISAPFNLASLIPSLMYFVVAYYIMVYFKKREQKFENRLLSFLSVSMIFLATANIMNWAHNTLYITQEIAEPLFYFDVYLTVEALKLPGYAFMLATFIMFYRRMSRL